jgi:hypothetical protein
MKSYLLTPLAFVLATASAFAQKPAAPAAPAAPAKPYSIVIEANKFDKDANVRLEKDTIDNFQYARLANFNTNAPVKAITYTVKPAEAGTWHILLKLRSGASIPLDQNAAMATVTTPQHCTECGAIQTPARTHVTGSLGDEAWQIVSLGVVKLEAGMKINLVQSTNPEALPRYTDLHRITLLDPDFISKTQPALQAPAAPAAPAKK